MQVTIARHALDRVAVAFTPAQRRVEVTVA